MSNYPLTSFSSKWKDDYTVKPFFPYIEDYIKAKYDPSKPKLITIDYENNFKSTYMSTPWKEEDEKKFNDTTDALDAMIKIIGMTMGIPKTHSLYVTDSMDGLSSASDMSNSTPTMPVKILTHSEIVLNTYPINNFGYIKYNLESTILPPACLIQWTELMEEAEKYSKVDTPVFIAQSRKVRDGNGHICDPWGRSMNTYKSHFNCNRSYRKQTEVLSNYRKEIIAWWVETSINGMSVAIIVWEEVQMAYLRKNTETKFLEAFNPTQVLENPLYVL